MKLIATSVDDHEKLFKIFSSPEVVEFTNFKRFEDAAALKLFLQDFIHLNENEPLQYGPYSISYNGELIGLCGIQQKDLENGVAELWYILDKNYWGRGLAKQAIQLLLSDCKKNPQVKTIFAEAVKSNIASWKILEQYGFVRTGDIAEGFRKENTFRDLYCYELNL